MRNPPQRKELICQVCDSTYQGWRDFGKCPSCRKVARKEYWQSYQQQPGYSEGIREKRKLLRRAVIDGYGGKCACCGEDRIEFLAVDHVNGGGRQDRKTRSVDQIMVAIVKADFPDDYRVLCHNCNQSLGWYGYCPHESLTA